MNNLQWLLNPNFNIFIQANALENDEMAAILPREEIS